MKPTHLLLLVALLAGYGQAAAPADAREGEAAAVAAPERAADSRDFSGAEAFVRAVYAGYAEPAVELPGRLWSARTGALIDRDRELAAEYAPYLDYDPICNCQDWLDLAVRSVELAPGPDGAVDATARFVNGGEETTTRLRLIREGGAWVVDDILNPGGPTLAESLAESNQRLETGQPAL